MKRLLACVVCSMSLLTLLPTAADAAGQYANFGVAVYVRVSEVPSVAKTWDAVQQQLKVNKVYLETFRSGVTARQQDITAAKEFFKAQGVKTSGGIATVAMESNRFQTFCYSTPADREKLKAVVELTARNFDEVILDDFFFTDCKCERCIEAKGAKTWTQFRLDQMAEVSRELVLAPARAVNPKVKVIIKYPNWYEHYQGCGYNLEVEPKLFDAVYTGTESRDPVNSDQHLQPYLSYSLVRYLENIKPGHNDGGWVDTGGGGPTLQRYSEQLWMTLLAKAPEITLFDLNQVRSGRVSSVASSSLRLVDGFLGKLGKPVGVKSYKPYHSTGEDYLHDYLGMIGLPIEMTPEFPTDARMVLLTESAKSDPKLVNKMKQHLVEGKSVLITSGLLRALQGKGIEEIAELECTGAKIKFKELRGGRGGAAGQLPVEITIPQIRYLTNDSWETIGVLTNGTGHPLVVEASYGGHGGTLYVLALPDDPGDLYKFPESLLTRIKGILTRDLFVQLSCPAQVCLFAYDNNTFVVESFLPESVKVGLAVDSRLGKVRDLVTGEVLSAGAAPPLAAGAVAGRARAAAASPPEPPTTWRSSRTRSASSRRSSDCRLVGPAVPAAASVPSPFGRGVGGEGCRWFPSSGSGTHFREAPLRQWRKPLTISRQSSAALPAG